MTEDLSRRQALQELAVLGTLGGTARLGVPGGPMAQARPRVFDITAYGAVGDGSTDNTAAINRALAAATAAGGGLVVVPVGGFPFAGTLRVGANVALVGVGTGSVLQPRNRNGETIFVSGNNASIERLRLQGSTPGVIQVRDGARDVLVDRVYFAPGVGQCVWLWECANVTVSNCTFDGTGYGVIQQIGYVSSHVRVTGCVARNMTADFVEMNCATVDSRDWIVDHNRYLPAAHVGTEVRFVGVTRVADVLIANNYVEGVGGDAAVHLEGEASNVRILGNHFKDCRVSDANRGHIYVLNSGSDVLVQGNVFEQTTLGPGMTYALSTASVAYRGRVLFSGNRVLNRAGPGGLRGVNIFSSSGDVGIEGNEFQRCDVGVEGVQASGRTRISGNLFNGCERGLSFSPAAHPGAVATVCACITTS